MKKQGAMGQRPNNSIMQKEDSNIYLHVASMSRRSKTTESTKGNSLQARGAFPRHGNGSSDLPISHFPYPPLTKRALVVMLYWAWLKGGG